MITGKEDASTNYARGHYTVGKEMMTGSSTRFVGLLTTVPAYRVSWFFHSFGGGLVLALEPYLWSVCPSTMARSPN